MKTFLAWAKSHGITFKRQRDEKKAFEVWKACQDDLDIRDRRIAELTEELRAFGVLLSEVKSDLSELSESQFPEVNLCQHGELVV